jgi:hypothetical protein
LHPARSLLLRLVLVAVMATQQVIAPVAGAGRTQVFENLSTMVVSARRMVRRISRETDKVVSCVWRISPRLTLKRLRLVVRRLRSALVERVEWSPFEFRLPPPVMA